jgi:hypothetical protein
MRTIMTLVVSAMLAPLIAHADGGTVCLREASGPFLVTVFVAPAPLRAGPIDMSVLVQDRKTGEVILDATVELAIEPLSGENPRRIARPTREQATNKLLKAVRIDLPAPGWWALRVFVSRGQEEGVLATRFQVAPATSRASAVWPFLLFPLFAIAVFALHQTLRG